MTRTRPTWRAKIAAAPLLAAVLLLSTALPLAAALLLAAAPASALDKPPDLDDVTGKRWNSAGVAGALADRAEVEPNDGPRTANALESGDVLRPAAISPAQDLDTIAFTANAGDAIRVGTDADGTLGQVDDTVVVLIAADSTTVLAIDDDSGPGRHSLLTFVAGYSGVYFGRIAAFDPTATGKYQGFVTCTPPAAPSCDLAGYEVVARTFAAPRPIPDGDPTGVTLDTLGTARDGTFLRDVIVALRASHTYVGDLTATLSYDVECDGTEEASATFLCRPGRATCSGGAGFGCPSDLSCDNTCFFSDASATEVGTAPFGCGASADTLSGGCFRPNATGTPLEAFDRLPKGGCFRLKISDSQVFDSGSVCGWSVYVASATTAVLPADWGGVKTLYR